MEGPRDWFGGMGMSERRPQFNNITSKQLQNLRKHMEGPSGLRVEKVPLNTVKHKPNAYANSSVNLFWQRVRALETGLILFGPMVCVTFITAGFINSCEGSLW